MVQYIGDFVAVWPIARPMKTDKLRNKKLLLWSVYVGV